MESVVIELQRDALDKEVSISMLLRKALVVARKLGQSEFLKWIELELNGYGEEDTPEYRVVRGKVKAWNPYNNGWIPVIIEDSKEAESLSCRPNNQSIAEIEHLVSNSNPNSSLHMPFPNDIERYLCEGADFETNVSLHIDKTALIKTLDAVRNIVLNWSLQLEEDGVLGEGLTFTKTEKEAATHTPQNINNFYGAVNSPQIAQGNEQSSQVSSATYGDMKAISEFVDKLQQNLQEITLGSSQKEELTAEIATMKAQVVSPKPKEGIIKECLTSVRTILESASGSAVGQLLLEAGRLLS